MVGELRVLLIEEVIKGLILISFYWFFFEIKWDGKYLKC